MSDIQLYLLESDSNKDEALRIAASTANKLETRQLKLIDLITGIGEYINNEDALLRVKSMGYLADVLTSLPSKVLSRQQRDLLNDFILSRVANGVEGIGHAAKALTSLDRLGTFDQERVEKITNTFLEYATPLVQAKQQTERYAVLTLLDLLFTKYRKALQNIHENSEGFMSRFIAFFEGEKDPRNLMIIFSILNVPMVEWDVSATAQDLFEAVFNYFPITFKPPPNDPYGITAQQLKDRLRDCLSSTPSFAPHSFPALLDKLDSTSINVKRDALQAIASCVSRYGPMTIDLYSITLWDSLKFEILNSQEEDLAEEALTGLQEIAKTLSRSPHDGPAQTYLKPVIKECNEYLEDAPTKKSEAAGKILGAIAKASPEISSYLIKAVLPELFMLYRNASTITKRRGLLEVLNVIIKSNVESYGRWRIDHIKDMRQAPNALRDYGEQCVDVYTSALAAPIHEVSFRLLALQGLRSLAMVRQLLDDESISDIIRLLDNILIHEESHGKDEMKAAAIDGLVELAHQKPQLVIDNAIPAFMGQLPDSDTASGNRHIAILEAFAKLSAEQQLFSTIIIRLKNKLYAAVRHNASQQYILAILSAIFYAFTRGNVDLSNAAVSGSLYTDVVLPLIRDASGAEAGFSSGAELGEPILDVIGRICNAILCKQQWVAQTEVCRDVYTLFREKDLSSVPPFTLDVNQISSRSMLLSTHLLSSLHRNASPHPDISELLTVLINFSLLPESTLSSGVRAATLSQISLIINKYCPPSMTEAIISTHLSPEASDSLLNPTRLTPTTLRAAFAILKGLVLRMDPKLPTLLPLYTNLFSHPDAATSSLAARAFGTILAPDDILTKPNHCAIYALHKQRLFTLSAPALIATYSSAATASGSQANLQRNALVALTLLTSQIPYAVLREQTDPPLAKLIPLLLQSLALQEDGSDGSSTIMSTGTSEIKASALTTLSNAVTQDPAAVSEHIPALVGRLLDVAVGPGLVSSTYGASGTPKVAVTSSSPPKLRAAALATLGTFPAAATTGATGGFRTEGLVPLRGRVVARLAEALDDRKRAVRREAVRCRVAWVKLGGGAAAEDEE